MGSRCTITIYAPSEPIAAKAAGEAFAEIARVERVLTDYDPDSESMKTTRASTGQWQSVSQTLWEVLVESEQFHDLSNGAFDPTVGAYTHLWRKARGLGGIPSQTELDLAGSASGFESLEIDQSRPRVRVLASGMILDFGGIGKGYAADRAIEILASLGFTTAMVDLGGDLALGDAPPESDQGWKVEIQSGLDESRESWLANCGVATSGDLERFYIHNGIRYSHILDPRTGIGLTVQRAVTVIAANAMTADALASAISVLGEENSKNLQGSYPHAKIEVVTTTGSTQIENSGCNADDL